MNTINIRALLVFLMLSLVFHIIFIAMYLTSQFLPFMLLATWSPNISAIVVIIFDLRENSGVRRLFGGWMKWGVSLGWYLAAISPIVITFTLTGGLSPFGRKFAWS